MISRQVESPAGSEIAENDQSLDAVRFNLNGTASRPNGENQMDRFFTQVASRCASMMENYGDGVDGALLRL